MGGIEGPESRKGRKRVGKKSSAGMRGDKGFNGVNTIIMCCVHVEKILSYKYTVTQRNLLDFPGIPLNSI